MPLIFKASGNELASDDYQYPDIDPKMPGKSIKIFIMFLSAVHGADITKPKVL